MKKYKYTSTFMYEGKRYYIRGDTEKELAVKEYKKRQELESGRNVITNNTTLEQWTLKCIETYKTNQSQITRQKYVSRIKHCVLEHIGYMKLKDVKPLHCQQVLNLQEGNSKTQINEVAQALKFIFERAVENKLIYENPAAHLRKPSGTRTSRRALTPTERKHVIQVGVTDRRYYLFMLMLFCGCRPSEASECMGKDIQKLDNFNVLHIRGLKTKNADRFVPIPDDFFELIKNTAKTEYIACYGNGNKISDVNRARLWQSFKRELNISMGCKMYRNQLIPPYPLAPDLVPYCLRHEYCTELARKGIDLRVAQKLMGHADVKLTANIYTNLDNSAVISAAQILTNVTPTVAPYAKNVEK